MKIKAIIGFLTILTASVFLSANAFATGIGFYGQAGGGEGEVELSTPGIFFSSTTSEFDVDTSHGGLGFVIDTNVSKNRLFNYRLNLGLESFELEDKYGVSPDVGSFVIDQDFGFGFVRTQKVRVWIGPELRMSWSRGDFDNSDSEIRLFGIGLGPVIGVNFHVSNKVSLGLKAGFLSIAYTGEIEDNATNRDEDVDIKERMAFINFAVLFRSGE